MDDCPRDISAVDAIRYVYLARELRKQGLAEAAQRWEARAAAGLHRIQPTRNKEPPIPAEVRSAG